MSSVLRTGSSSEGHGTLTLICLYVYVALLPDKSCHWWGSFPSKHNEAWEYAIMFCVYLCVRVLPSASMAPWDS